TGPVAPPRVARPAHGGPAPAAEPPSIPARAPAVPPSRGAARGGESRSPEPCSETHPPAPPGFPGSGSPDPLPPDTVLVAISTRRSLAREAILNHCGRTLVQG